jgi:hypothetical protein
VKVLTIAFVCLAATLLLAPARAADDPKADKELSLSELSLDVEALQVIYALRLTNDQLKAVKPLAAKTAEPERKRKSVKASDEFRKVLTDLRAALIDANDDDKIGELEDDFEVLMENGKVKLDNSFDVTQGARQATPGVLKLLTADQLDAFYDSEADDTPEPLGYLTNALTEVRGLDKKKWNEKRDDIADNVAWAVAGLDEKKGDKINKKVVALLNKARAMSDEEFKKKNADLQKQAKLLVGTIARDLVLRHHAEHRIAEMLSNPRLAAVIQARLK